jgi:hypothetical protein
MLNKMGIPGNIDLITFLELFFQGRKAKKDYPILVRLRSGQAAVVKRSKHYLDTDTSLTGIITLNRRQKLFAKIIKAEVVAYYDGQVQREAVRAFIINWLMTYSATNQCFI